MQGYQPRFIPTSSNLPPPFQLPVELPWLFRRPAIFSPNYSPDRNDHYDYYYYVLAAPSRMENSSAIM